MSSIKSFVRTNKIRMDVEWADNNPHMHDTNWKANHYKCVLRFERRQHTVYFSMGIGLTGEPTVHDVLGCLASDAAGYESALDFEDWASEYGYDTDSRKAERTFNTVAAQSKKLRKFLGDSLYQELLWDTERL